MLKKMRWRLILAAMLAFFTVIVLIAVLVNAINYYVVTSRADQTLSYILTYEIRAAVDPDSEAKPEDTKPEDMSEIQGDMFIPGSQDGAARGGIPGTPDEGAPAFVPMMVLPDLESNYMTRFFIVRFDADDNVISTSTDYIAAVDEADAVTFAQQAQKRRADRGYIKAYRYAKETVGDTSIVIFLNAAKELQYASSLRRLTTAVVGISLILVFILVYLLSGKAIRPIANNIERQKQFITDASHELKTPLTSISTSIDVISLEHGEDEWTDNIRKQTGRMTRLVSELVTLSRLDEEIPLPAKEHFSLSDAAWEIVEMYQPQAKAHDKKWEADIQDDVCMFGDRNAVLQMLSVLLDNAVRYSDPKGNIRFSVQKKKSKAEIEVFNTCQYEKPPDVKRLFDRFYRPDSSRNTATGGTGVGLAIAKAVVQAHGGTITASCPSGNSMTIKIII